MISILIMPTRTLTLIEAHTQKLLEAVAFLHRHRIGHRDVSLENVLLRDGEARDTHAYIHRGF